MKDFLLKYCWYLLNSKQCSVLFVMQAPLQVKSSDEKRPNELHLFIAKLLKERQMWALHRKARPVTESHSSLLYLRLTEPTF